MDNKHWTFKNCLSLLAVLFVLISSCDRNIAHKKIHVKSPFGNDPVYLYKLDTTGFRPVDSLLKPSSGEFSFVLKDTLDFIYKIVNGPRSVTFIPSVEGVTNLDLSQERVIAGSNKTVESFVNYHNYVSNLEKQADSLRDLFRAAQVTDSFALVRERVSDSLYALLDKAYYKGKTWIKSNPESIGIFSVINSALYNSAVFNYKANPEIFLFSDSVMQIHYPHHPYTLSLHNRVTILKSFYGVAFDNSAEVKKQIDFPPITFYNLKKQPQDIVFDKEVSLIYLWDDTPASLASVNDAARLLSDFRAMGYGDYAIADIENVKQWASLVELKKLWTNNLSCSGELYTQLLRNLTVRKLPYFMVVNKQGKILAGFSNTAMLDEWFRQYINQKELKNK